MCPTEIAQISWRDAAPQKRGGVAKYCRVSRFACRRVAVYCHIRDAHTTQSTIIVLATKGDSNMPIAAVSVTLPLTHVWALAPQPAHPCCRRARRG
jgi:hypothetical protein